MSTWSAGVWVLDLASGLPKHVCTTATEVPADADADGDGCTAFSSDAKLLAVGPKGRAYHSLGYDGGSPGRVS
jgi:hypothetical protein